MKIEVGKRYVRRDGSVTPPLEPDFFTDTGFALEPERDFVYGTFGKPTDHQVFSSEEHAADLISEYVE